MYVCGVGVEIRPLAGMCEIRSREAASGPIDDWPGDGLRQGLGATVLRMREAGPGQPRFTPWAASFAFSKCMPINQRRPDGTHPRGLAVPARGFEVACATTWGLRRVVDAEVLRPLGDSR